MLLAAWSAMLSWNGNEADAGLALPGLRCPETARVPSDSSKWSDPTMMTSRPFSRRGFLGCSIAATAAATLHGTGAAAEAGADDELGFPLVDLHAHLDNSSLDKVLPLGRERHVRFGIVEHAGTRENKYPVVLSTDAELSAYIKMLDGQGVYKGVQAEWTDWMSCFSPEVLAQLDYVLTDAMTFPGKNGQRVKLWEKTAADHGGHAKSRALHGPVRRLARPDHEHRADRHSGQCILACPTP